MALPQYLGTCKSFQDLCSACAYFFQKAVNDSHAEIVRRDVGAVTTTVTDLQSRPLGRIARGDVEYDQEPAYRHGTNRACEALRIAAATTKAAAPLAGAHTHH